MTVSPRQSTDHPLQQWQEALWLLIALLTPLLVNLWVEQQFEASKVWLLRTLVWLLIILWLSGWASGLRPRQLPVSIRTCLLGLALIFVLSTLFSPNRYTAIFGTLDRANGALTQASYLLLFFCVATQIDSRRSQRLLRAIVLTAAPICLLGLGQAMGWQPLPIWSDARSPAVTTLGRANFTGAYLALLLPLSLTATEAAKRWRRGGYAALVALELAVIALTQARAAWIAALFGVCALLWLRAAPAWSRRARWLSALGGGLAMGGALLLIWQRGVASGGSIAARWAIWQASLRLLWPRLWLGYGADTLELHFPAVYPPTARLLPGARRRGGSRAQLAARLVAELRGGGDVAPGGPGLLDFARWLAAAGARSGRWPNGCLRAAACRAAACRAAVCRAATYRAAAC